MFQIISLTKSIAVTILIVLLLQIKIGNDTVEDQAVFWFRSSSIVQPIQTVVDGGVKLIRNTLSGVANLFHFKIFQKVNERAGNRDLNFKIERSREYIREQAERVARKLDSEVKSEQKNTSQEN
ncbi:MAG: hypothetical protein KDD34_07635 [Bdellovibrionales bacterium]|nr:hypothetical protein [Bdellovibrionales bacterium]